MSDDNKANHQTDPLYLLLSDVEMPKVSRCDVFVNM